MIFRMRAKTIFGKSCEWWKCCASRLALADFTQSEWSTYLWRITYWRWLGCNCCSLCGKEPIAEWLHCSRRYALETCSSACFTLAFNIMIEKFCYISYFNNTFASIKFFSLLYNLHIDINHCSLTFAIVIVYVCLFVFCLMQEGW